MLKEYKSLLVRFAQEQQGVAIVEYGMLVGLIAIPCFVATQILGTSINGALITVIGVLAAI